jgi:Domain of unknown function (DUF4276)
MIKLLVEGGGNNNHELKTKCRKAFSQFLERAGFKGRMPRIVACGSRQAAYEQFCAMLNGENEIVILLVDAEAPVHCQSSWDHVAQRQGDKWSKPAGATDAQLHLMTQCMESWFFADRAALAKYFGNGFNPNALPSASSKIEEIGKSDVFDHLKRATKDTRTKGAYDKGAHSFNILDLIDPALVRAASPRAEAFIAALDALLKA